MPNLTRRGFIKISSMAGAVLAGIIAVGQAGKVQAAGNGLTAASSAMEDNNSGVPKTPGIQAVYALCEVTGGGQKVYGIAVKYDTVIDPASLALDTYNAGVVPAAKGFMPGMPQSADKNSGSEAPVTRLVATIYTNAAPALLSNQQSVAGQYVIAEFAHDPDLSIPTTDSDKVAITQSKDIKTAEGAVYAANNTVWDNAGRRGNNVVIRGVDDWEQNHWWWDDARATTLEYSIYLPKSFLAAGGENKEYPLVIAITHSGTSYDGTCAETLTEQCIASIWGMPEQQAEHECVVITPRYERTTMNDYWEHTYDVENTYRLVESMLKNTWNFGNPNLEDRRDKVLKIDPKRVYCTGWSMGAMTSLWMMAKHPDTFAAGLIIAGQQRPADMVGLAKQKALIITGSKDDKATPWNEKCVPVWEQAGAKVTRPANYLDPALIFPLDNQKQLTEQVNGYLAEGGNITFLTFEGIDHMASARKFFYIKAARDWLFNQVKA
ncbi:alpha/beta hydrolase-fold protein [Thiofilum flexile]|uniref:alpha/beta hydrolase-fold protein n=1 Tax=Thiofilum flexile TaxID=125627 RepID=UPI0003655916|nr:prolyl oligopeptidase family serine peptidase [Thiofilum flexile]